jgi:hypothetical protein
MLWMAQRIAEVAGASLTSRANSVRMVASVPPNAGGLVK